MPEKVPMSQNLQGQSTVWTAARQTMAAWSKLIESREDIPVVFITHFDNTFDGEQRFPLVIWTPALERFPRKTTEKLICDTRDALYIFEKNEDQIDLTCYGYRDLYGSEVGIVLLDSWLTIRGKTSGDDASVSTIEFNTTSTRYFATILDKLRPFPRTMDKMQIAAEKDKFNALSRTNFKFMNYGRESLVPGETVLQFLLQEEIRQPIFTIFGKTFYKTLSLTHLSIITDKELILIQDTGSGRETRASRYGGIWQYIPLHCIDSVSLSEVVNERLTLSIRCQPDKMIEKLFDISNLPELQQFCFELQLLTERAHSTG
jgi:hypothetical protein